MKKTYPEDIGQIGDFYKGKLEHGDVEPSAGLWDNIESSLNSVPSLQQVPTQVPVPGTNILTFNAIWKGALIMGTVGTIAVLINNQIKERQDVPNNNQSIENKNIILSDTVAEVKTEGVITSKKREEAIIETDEQIKNEKLINEPSVSKVENNESIVQDTVSTKQPVQGAEEKEEKPKVQEEETPKVAEKEAVKKPTNIFERKLKQQKDTSGHLFKPKK